MLGTDTFGTNRTNTQTHVALYVHKDILQQIIFKFLVGSHWPSLYSLGLAPNEKLSCPAWASTPPQMRDCWPLCPSGGTELPRPCPLPAEGCFTDGEFPLPLTHQSSLSQCIASLPTVLESHLVLSAMFSTSLPCNIKKTFFLLNLDWRSHLISDKYPDMWLEVLPGQLPVFLNSQKVDQKKEIVKIWQTKF